MALTIEQALQQGLSAHKDGNLKDAERLYRAILQSQPTHPDANHNLGVIAISRNEIQLALPLLKTALDANPKIEQFWLSYIGALIKDKQFDCARGCLKEGEKVGLAGGKVNALEAHLKQLTQSAKPKSVERKIGLTSKEQRKKIAKSKKTSSSNPSQLHLDSLLKHYQNGRYDYAEALAKSITHQYPQHQFAWTILAAALRKNGRSSESIIASQKSVQMAPQEARTHYNLGITLNEQNRLKEAEASFRQAIALKPDFAEAHSNLGITLRALGKLEEAQAGFRRAISLKSDYVRAYSHLGLTLQELGRLDESEESLTRAIAMKPDFAEAHRNLGNTLNAKGSQENALKHFERNLQLIRGIKPVDPHHRSFRQISNAKLDHDIEQFEYLASLSLQRKKFKDLAVLYQAVKNEINHASDTAVFALNEKHQRLLWDTYNRPIHILKAPVPDKPTLGDNLDTQKITSNYFEHGVGLTYVDDFLSPTTLISLRKFLLGSTIWFDFFHDGGYLGAYLSEGLASPLILQIAEDLRNKFPKIFKHHESYRQKI